MQKCKVGLQLYSVATALYENPAKTLGAVKEMGYDAVEFAGLFDNPPEVLYEICTTLDLKPLTLAQGLTPILETPASVAATLKALGVKHCAVGLSVQELAEDYPGCVDKLRRAAALLYENGLQLLYHNHDREFVLQRDGIPVLEALCRDVPYLLPELDVCWALYGGYDPAAAVKQLPRMPHIHLKDFVCRNLPADFDFVKNATGNLRSRPEDGFLYRPLGCGCVDIPAVIKAAEEAETPYIIVEQDWDFMDSCLADAAKSREYLRTLGY